MNGTHECHECVYVTCKAPINAQLLKSTSSYNSLSRALYNGVTLCHPVRCPTADRLERTDFDWKGRGGWYDGSIGGRRSSDGGFIGPAQRGISGPNVGSLIINVRQLVRGGWSGFRVVCMRLYHRADDSQITRRNFHGLLPEKNVMSGMERHQCGQFQDQRQDEEKVGIHIRDIPGPDLYPRNF